MTGPAGPTAEPAPIVAAPASGALLRPPQRANGFAVVRRLLRSPRGAAGAAMLLSVLLMALLAPRLAPYEPTTLHLRDQLAPPSGTYWFGTDELGRDVLSRVLYGARPAVAAGLLTVALAAVAGAATGLVAGYRGGWFDGLTGRVWDTVLAFPAIFLAIGIVSVLGAGWINAVLAIAIVNTPVFSRLVRASTLATRNQEFVTAAHAIGCSGWRTMLRHVLPHCLSPLVVQMAIAVPEAILVEASLSFLGLGTQPPAPSWGNMLAAAQGYLSRSLAYGVFPGLAITLVVVGMNLFAEGLQDALDPRRSRGGRGA